MGAAYFAEGSNELYETLCIDSPKAMVLCEAGQVVLKINPSFASLFGFVEEEAIGSRFDAIVTPGLTRCAKTNQVLLASTNDRSRVKNESGNDVVVTTRGAEENGDLRLVALSLDVSEKNSMQEALDENAMRYRALFQDNSAPMWLVDPESGRFFEVNKAAVDFYGYTEDQFRSMSIFDLNRMTKEELLAKMAKAAKREENRFIFEHHLASGEKRLVEVLTTSVLVKGKKLIHSIMHDETEKASNAMALAEKTAELDQLFANAPFAIFLCDGNRRILRANTQASKMFGYGEEEMEGRTTEELVVPEADQNQGWAYSDGVYLKQQVMSFEAERKRKDGSRLFVHCIGFPLVLAEDTLGSYVIYQDITENRLSREMLEVSEQKFRSLFEGAQAVMLLISPEDGHILWANPAAAAYYGYSHERLLTLNHSDLSVLDPEKLHQDRMRVLQGVKKHLLSRHRLANGKVRDIEAFTGPVELEGDTVLFSVIHDVTARTRAESLLKRERAYLDNLFELAPDAVAVTDERNVVIRVNRSFCELFGYMSRDYVGKELGSLVSGQNSAIAIEAADLTRKIKSGAVIRIETSRVKKTGETFPCRVITRPMTFEDGTGGGYVLYHDLTEERAREGQLTITGEIMKNSTVILFRWPNEIGGEKVLYVSENIRQWGYEPEEITSETFSYYGDLVHPEDGDYVREATRNRIEAGIDNFEVEYRIRKANGEWIWVSDRTRIPRDGNGNVQYQEGILIDITERKKVEDLTREVNESLRKHLLEMDMAFEQTISVLAITAEAKDPYTAGHQRRVAKLSRAIAEGLGMESKRARKVELAALVHDIGKIEVPAEILVKPGKLSPDELELIKIHPSVGYRILKGIEIPWPLAEIVHQHHERIDGTGYPRGLKGQEILLEARIISVADTVEAMASHRPYRPALGIEAALAELSNKRGLSYDSDVVDVCLGLFHEKGFSFEEGKSPTS